MVADWSFWCFNFMYFYYVGFECGAMNWHLFQIEVYYYVNAVTAYRITGYQ